MGSTETKISTTTMISLTALREEYWDSRIDPIRLGFCCIYLGGSVVHRSNLEQVVESGSDWDGLGVVETREDLVELVMHRMSDLMIMLKGERFEGSLDSWIEAAHATDRWDVISLSGWTSTGSNRAMKIWSRQHLETVMSDMSSHSIGVLAHKFPRNIQANYPDHGSSLFISQATRLTKDISLRFEDDFLERPFSNEDTQIPLIAPALLCDLLLTSHCIYEKLESLGTALKAQVYLKWLFRSRENKVEYLLPILYRWRSFPAHYRSHLRTLARALQPGLQYQKSYCRRTTRGRSNSFCIHSQISDCHENGYQALVFEPLRKDQFIPKARPQQDSDETTTLLLLKSQYDIKYDEDSQSSQNGLTKNYRRSGTLILNQGNTKHEIIEQHVESSRSALRAFSLCRRSLPPDSIQQLVAIDPEEHKSFSALFSGNDLFSIRATYHGAKYGTIKATSWPKEPFSYERWLVSIDTRRVEDTMRAYQHSWTWPMATGDSDPTCQQLMKHPSHEKLQNEAWFHDLWHSFPKDMRQPQGHIPSPEFLLEFHVFVNGNDMGSMRNQLQRAQRLLDPATTHFQRLPTVFGLGDSHSKNVLLDERRGKGTMPSLRYTSYDGAGFYNPSVDMAAPLYMDCFFPIFHADHFTRGQSTGNPDMQQNVQWSIDKGGIRIDYDVSLDMLDRVLATIKLEYLVRPIFELLHTQIPSEDIKLMEDILGSGLFCTAILGREFFRQPDLFFLNLAMGLSLAEDCRGTLTRIFGWKNWPTSEAMHPDTGMMLDLCKVTHKVRGPV